MTAADAPACPRCGAWPCLYGFECARRASGYYAARKRAPPPARKPATTPQPPVASVACAACERATGAHEWRDDDGRRVCGRCSWRYGRVE